MKIYSQIYSQCECKFQRDYKSLACIVKNKLCYVSKAIYRLVTATKHRNYARNNKNSKL